MNQSLFRWLTAGGAAIAAAALAVACGGGGSSPSPSASLTSVSVNPTSVIGGGTTQGTVTFSAGPSAAATVALSSDNSVATVPSTVTVAAGSTSANFTVSTTAVGTATPVVISGTYNGATQRTTPSLTVNPGVTANFSVTSLSEALRRTNPNAPGVPFGVPAGSVDACPLINSANPVLDCQFDGGGSVSTLPIATYTWTYSFGSQTRTDTTSTAQFKPTVSGCGFFGGVTTPSGVQFIGMTVQLRIKDTAGNESAVKSNANVRIFPAGNCGYGF